ncbi:MAG: PQQ-like beta-propeller repeat protein, partial [Gemmatimonadota bacterium]|nr:PQQ-like beta-propeller repeat protein [Gemmatimonadota bacterium]
GPTVLWKSRDPAGAMSVPYADKEVAVFNTISDARVLAFDARSGAKWWEVQLLLPRDMRGRGLPPGRLVGKGEVVVVPAWDLYGLDRKTGRIRWKLAPSDDFPGAGVALGEDGHLYSTGHYLYRIDPAGGTVLWRADLGEQPFSPVERGGVVYVGTRGIIPGSSGALGAGHAAAVEAATGRVLWKTAIPAPEDRALGGLTGAGAVTSDLFVVSSPNGRVYGLDRQTGRVRWETKGSGPYDAGVVVVGDVAVTAGDAGSIDGFDLATGRPRWKVAIGGSVSDPLAAQGNTVFAVNGRLWAVTASGEVLWRHDAGESVPYSTGARPQDDNLYIGTSYGRDIGFFALRVPG